MAEFPDDRLRVVHAYAVKSPSAYLIIFLDTTHEAGKPQKVDRLIMETVMFARFPASHLGEFEDTHEFVPNEFQAHYKNGPWFRTDLAGARELATRPDADTITLLPVAISEAE
ncbi:hypothetical protein KDX23_18120 [Burkholderia vietnamiensis]|nr:hypothetical protein [Burkholderia vietnamiensis]